MGSGAETTEETAVQHLVGKGEKVGAFRQFTSTDRFPWSISSALPATTRSIAVLDRCAEPGSAGEPLYVDVITALEGLAAWNCPFKTMPSPGGRYGLSSKEFTPPWSRRYLKNFAKPEPKNHFDVSINE